MADAKKPTTAFWAIKHYPSGGFLPRPSSSDHEWHSTTKLEPSLTEPPRLYTRRGDAEKAMRWWVLGILRRTTREVCEDPAAGLVVEVAGTRFALEPQAHRAVGHVSVVPMLVTQDFRDWKNRP